MTMSLAGAPGALGVPAQDFYADEHVIFDDAAPGPLVRIGTLNLPIGELPAVIPFLGMQNLVIKGGDDESRRDVVEEIMTRIFASVDPRALQVTVFDPHLKGILSEFDELRTHEIFQGTLLIAPRDERELEGQFRNLRDDARKTVIAKSAQGFRDSDFSVLWSEDAKPPFM